MESTIKSSNIKGNAIMICVTTSGGVKIAAPAKNNRSAYFLFFFKKLTETMPSLARKVIIKGSSKTSPNASNSFEAKLKYSRMEGRGCIISEANPKKNLKPYGNTIKYPKNAPPTKKKVDRKTMGAINRFSLL